MPVSLLLVDDEIALLALLKRFLERKGYAVEITGKGQDAIDMVTADPTRFDVVVLDLGLPDKPGKDVLGELLAVSQSIKILIASGTPYCVDGLPPHQRPRVDAMLKPYTPRMLEEALSKFQVSR